MGIFPGLSQLIEAVRTEAISKEPLDLLANAARVRGDLDELGESLLDHFVEQAREAGCSWSQIGAVLGVSKQAAQQRHTSTESLSRRLLSRIRGATTTSSTRSSAHDPFSRFTDRARATVVHAQQEARRLSHERVGTEHILLGLLAEREGVAAKALVGLGVSLDDARRRVEEVIGRGETPPSGSVPFTPRSKKVLELSLREALDLGHDYIGTEHILLGLLREREGVGARVLASLGLDPASVRKRVLAILADR